MNTISMQITLNGVKWTFHNVNAFEFFYIESEKIIVFKRNLSKNFIIAEKVASREIFDKIIAEIFSCDFIEIEKPIIEF